MAIAFAALTLGGCTSLTVGSQSEFSCPGMPMGVVCQTPHQVYASTHGSQTTTARTANTQPMSPPGVVPQAPMPAHFVLPGVSGGAALQPVTGAPVPIREPARVMRVWIAPWIEKKTDHLHWPSYVFAEVQPRKWTVGRPEFGSMRASQPLQVRQTVAQMPIGSTASTGTSQAGVPSATPQNASAPAGYTQPQVPTPASFGAQGVTSHPY